MVVYDIGANTGVFSSAVAKLSNVSTVYAFEPIPEVYERCVQHLGPFPHAHCYNVALGDMNQQAGIFVSEFTPSSSLLPMAPLHQAEFPYTARVIRQEVQVVRLDDFVLEHQLQPPYFVKIDVQGFEDRVLRGGEQTIKSAKYCMIEMSLVPLYETSVLFDDIYHQMRELGFQLMGFVDEAIGKSGRMLQVDGLFGRLSAHGSISSQDQEVP